MTRAGYFRLMPYLRSPSGIGYGGNGEPAGPHWLVIFGLTVHLPRRPDLSVSGNLAAMSITNPVPMNLVVALCVKSVVTPLQMPVGRFRPLFPSVPLRVHVVMRVPLPAGYLPRARRSKNYG